MNNSTNGHVTSIPSLHWGVVLALSVATFGLFGIFWAFRQGAFARKLDPTNRSMLLFAASLALFLFSILLNAVVAITIARGGQGTDLSTVSMVLWMFEIYFFVSGFLQIRRSLSKQFGVVLNPCLTAILNVYYLQYHLYRIANSERNSDPPEAFRPAPGSAVM